MRLSAAALVLTLAVAVPAAAQVEKAAMRTTGISCGTCAFVSEIYLSRLPDLDVITISKSQEAVMVTYKPGTRFQPKDLREALKKTEVGVVQFQISARGRAVEEGGRQLFLAGKDRFQINQKAKVPKIPANTLVQVEGIVDDSTDPMDLKVLTVKPLTR